MSAGKVKVFEIHTYLTLLHQCDIPKQRGGSSMGKIILVTESGADIPPELAESYDIHTSKGKYSKKERML